MSETKQSEAKAVDPGSKTAQDTTQDDLAAIVKQTLHDLASGEAPSTHEGLAEIGEERGVL